MTRGEIVLFIHSTGTAPALWTFVPDAAIGGRRRLQPANIGYEGGDAVERGRVVTVKDDAARVASAVPPGEDRVHVIAHSYGGLVGLHLAPMLGERLASFFLYEPVVFGALLRTEDADPDGLAEARRFAADPWFFDNVERGGREEWLEAFIDYWNGPGSWARMPAPMRSRMVATGWKMFQEVRAVFFDETPLDRWELQVPTTIALGERTTAASRAMSRGLAKGRANVTLVELGGVGHMGLVEDPAQVNGEIARHFARLEAG